MERKRGKGGSRAGGGDMSVVYPRKKAFNQKKDYLRSQRREAFVREKPKKLS